jgi:hypothetical protein
MPALGTITALSRDPEPDVWKNQAFLELSRANIASAVVRPLRANDLNTSYGDIFNGFTMNATAGNASVLTSASFATAVGKAYAIYGFRDLTPGTKSVTGLQANVNGKAVPLQPVPVVGADVDENGSIYFSPIYALQPNQTFTVQIFGTVASAVVTVQLIGFIAEAGGNA